MSAEDSTQLLPVMGGGEASFDHAMRGYDKHQVDAYVARLEADLLDLKADRELALAVSADRAAQLADSAAHIESLQQVLAKSQEQIDSTNVAAHVADRVEAAHRQAAAVIDSAQREAAGIIEAGRISVERSTAVADGHAAELIQQARAEAARERTENLARIAVADAALAARTVETEQHLADTRTQAATELEAARTEAGSLLMIATDERDRLNAAAAAARDDADTRAAAARYLANEDFDITLRKRRTEAERQDAADLAATQARTAAMIAQAQERVRALDEQRNDLHQALINLHHRLGDVITEAIG